jgi:hypothetical protein
MTTNLLLVPIHLDALYLPNGMSVAEATADFSRLPYFQGRDHNPDTVNLSESILTQAFQNKNLYLKPGIHLHWALPDALTKEGKQTKERENNFPAVPNRWLVRRKSENGDKNWIVESDYLFPANTVYQEDSITYPDFQASEGGPRFRYLGRKVLLDNWLVKDDNAQYLDRLTAVGYGEPTFAAFYPNCRSVFGFHDPDAKPEDKPQYDVLGWYSDPTKSYLTEFIKDFKNEFKQQFNKDATNDELLESIKQGFKWDGVKLEQDQVPPEIVCHARLTFNTSSPPPPETNDITISLVVANTGTEALSAYLATTLTTTIEDPSKKQLIENQLEALQLFETLSSQALDIGAKFEELRHESGFNAVSAGTVWKICLDSSSSQLEKDQSQTKLNLPSDWVSALKSINEMQQEYDPVYAQVKSRQRQLFADWYKYMVCVYPPEHSWDNYPDIDQVKAYIQAQGIQVLDKERTNTGELGKNSINNRFEDKLHKSSSLASSLASKLNDLTDIIETYNTSHSLNYRLEVVASPRYWEPKEPVVLITGKDEEDKKVIKTSERHGQDGRLDQENGLLQCHLFSVSSNSVKSFDDLITNKKFDIIFTEIDKITPINNIGFVTWTKQPWNPFLLQWLVEIFPVRESGNKSSPNHNYGYDFIVKNYQLEEQAIDLAAKTSCETVGDTKEENNKIKTDRDSNVYSGFSILTPYANDLLLKRIVEFLDKAQSSDKKRILDIYYQEKSIPTDKQKLEFLVEQIVDIKTWYSGKYLNSKDDFTDFIYTAICSHEELKHKESKSSNSDKELKLLNCLSQSLGGFNQALLMRKQTLQLMIDDPIGFEDYQRFTEQVRDLVDDEVRSAPQPLDDFNPIRAGEMRIISLELIDTFGQVRNLNWDEQIIRPEAMKTKQKKKTEQTNQNRVLLSPRLVQPCRIDFRWLDANDTNNQVTDAETTPICGWILPNNLNGSLMIYDNNGVALGSINVNANWDHAPGNKPLEMDNKNPKPPKHPKIPNPHLCKVVAKIIDLGKEFLENFLACLNNALENIDPENFAQHESIALLMGRPIAVVRASVNLELQGLAAINQDWNVFRKEMQQNSPMENRDKDNFDGVQFPIRIGEFKQFNDGVIGYWKEDAQGEYEGDIFYSQQSDIAESKYIETQAFDPETNDEVNPDKSKQQDAPLYILQSINSPAQILTMLVDPRCVFHATSGILPSKAINIPPEQYTEALKNIKVTFLTAPILTDKDQLHLPLLSEPGYDWSWLEKRGESYLEITMTPMIEKATFTTVFTARFPNGNISAETCWNSLMRIWLHEVSDDLSKAEIIAKDKRHNLPAELMLLQDAIDEILDLYHIVIEPASSRATFGSSQGIRDGWLVLSKNTQQNEV